MMKLLSLAAAALLLGGCVYTGAVPLSFAGNVWRLETRGEGGRGVAESERAVLRQAALLTIENGYTHFVLTEPVAEVGNLPAKAILYGRSQSLGIGTQTSLAVAPGLPPIGSDGISARTAVDVVMYRRGDPGWERAVSASEVLGWRS
jgi:hypothetical protein